MNKDPLSLRDLLKLRGISQAALAEKIGCYQPAISRWLTGVRPHPAQAVKIGEALGAYPEILQNGEIVWRPD
jgi:transcriptional regulator with XRE-family HTH domain